MAAPDQVLELVERFQRNLGVYKRAEYKETQVRVEFIDPFFEALGWDVRNVAGLAEQYKDVIHEDALKVSGATRAPDYCFRVGGTRKFFVEAKRPSAALKGDVGPAYQLHRYAWSAKLPLSILTDFEEFAVYDCRQRPKPADKASVGRVMYYTFDQYPDHWDDIYGVFAKDSVLKGSFDRYVQDSKKKRGTGEVDAEFLKEIEGWREALARNVALRNPGLSVYELNDAVQRTIDRIIFLRICEDRGIEAYGRLMGLVNGADIYPRLVELYRQADQKYNAGLFDFRADALTTTLAIDDRVLKPILADLYYPQSPYEFSVLPADILGQVYEQFLGKVIRLTPAHRAVVEEKPEVKKAGGVYYTPTYIVDYIVRQTVGKLVEGKTPRQIAGSARTAPLRILDPACGSGSFLLGAYQYMLDHYLHWYETNDPESHAKGRDPAVYRGARGDWRLTSAEKKRILLTHIYGVDIDRQAVEVTKLSLLLKVLEGEQQVSFWGERALPNLEDNVKCGNSLIGPDYYEGRQTGMFDDEELRRVNAFDWQAEFPRAMAAGGFDAVIGNPPWGGDIDKDLDYLHNKYPATTQEHTDSFKLFTEAGLALARSNGLVSMIVPNTLLRQRRIKDVRTLMLQNQIINLVDLGEDVFAGVVALSCVFVIEKQKPTKSHQVSIINLRDGSNEEKASLLEEDKYPRLLVDQREFNDNADVEFMAPLQQVTESVVPLGSFKYLKCRDAGINYQRVNVGMQEKGRSDLSKRLLYESEQEKAQDKMFWKGADINRYWIAKETGRYCRTNYHDFIRANEVVRLNEEVYDTTPKILLRQTADHIIATVDYRGLWFGRSITAITPVGKSDYRVEYILGLLNSQYLRWLYEKLVQEKGRVFAQVKLSKIKQLPIRTIDFDDPADVARHDKMVELVACMLDLHERLSAAATPADKRLYQRQIDATDAQIDALVYALYGLTEEEIEIVEGARG